MKMVILYFASSDEIGKSRDDESFSENGGFCCIFCYSIDSDQMNYSKQGADEWDDETSHNINSLLKAEGISVCEDEDLEGKTVPIGALDVATYPYHHP